MEDIADAIEDAQYANAVNDDVSVIPFRLTAFSLLSLAPLPQNCSW